MKTNKYRQSEMPNLSFTEIFVCENYAVDTLINGNISECITYLKDLLECGNVGIKEVYSQLEQIKTNCPDRYNFVKTAVFDVPNYSDFKTY